MSFSFNPSGASARAFRAVMCNDRVSPLSGPSHLHTYPGGYHMADNLAGGASIYYNFDSNGNMSGINLKPGGLPGRSL